MVAGLRVFQDLPLPLLAWHLTLCKGRQVQFVGSDGSGLKLLLTKSPRSQGPEGRGETAGEQSLAATTS